MHGCPLWVLCVLSGRGLCYGLITRPEESYRLWCVLVCDLETSRMRRIKLIKVRRKGDSLRFASARGKWSCPVATAALSTYSLTRIAWPRVQNRATLPSCCRSLTR
jgi:hypothetical protein